MIESASFVYAKTMPDNPHHYTLRKTWKDDDFVWAVNFIRDNGYTAYWKGRRYTQINVNDQFYWTMGAPVKDTILINRKKLSRETPYDTIGDKYDTLFVDNESKEEDALVMGILGDVSGLSVLDVGCGTGLLLDHLAPKEYTGIDVSAGMLSVFKKKHPAANLKNTDLYSFSGGRYDLVVALFGTASYLSASEIERLPMLAKQGGRVVAMFFDQDYYPATHKLTGITMPYTCYTGQLEGDITKINGAVLVDMRL